MFRSLSYECRTTGSMASAVVPGDHRSIHCTMHVDEAKPRNATGGGRSLRDRQR
jgi:hypothetical protein